MKIRTYGATVPVPIDADGQLICPDCRDHPLTKTGEGTYQCHIGIAIDQVVQRELRDIYGEEATDGA